MKPEWADFSGSRHIEIGSEKILHIEFLFRKSYIGILKEKYSKNEFSMFRNDYDLATMFGGACGGPKYINIVSYDQIL